LNSVQVAGKTGTAEVADAKSHAWFAGFAPADDPQVVVVVLVENAGTGGSVAAPIARKVIAAALGL
jgi:peptidoglycan glycosyltransferase